MAYYLLALFFVGLAALLMWIGRIYSSVTSITAFQKENKNPILARRLRVISLVMGERRGTQWIRAMGVLILLVGVAAIVAAAYVAIVKPEQIFAS